MKNFLEALEDILDKPAWKILLKISFGSVILLFLLLFSLIKLDLVHITLGPLNDKTNDDVIISPFLEKGDNLIIRAADIELIITKLDLNLRENPSQYSQKIGKPIPANTIISEIIELHDTGENYFWAKIVLKNDGRTGFINCRDIYVKCIPRDYQDSNPTSILLSKK